MYYFDKGMIENLVAYGVKPVDIKATKLYNKCMRRGKIRIAISIKMKYNVQDFFGDDRMVAYAMVLAYKKHNK